MGIIHTSLLACTKHSTKFLDRCASDPKRGLKKQVLEQQEHLCMSLDACDMSLHLAFGVSLMMDTPGSLGQQCQVPGWGRGMRVWNPTGACSLMSLTHWLCGPGVTSLPKVASSSSLQDAQPLLPARWVGSVAVGVESGGDRVD